jgi:5'-nucleotidase
MRHPAALLLAACFLSACASAPSVTPVEVSILGINDFHGNIQAQGPVPKTLRVQETGQPDQTVAVPAGGAAFVAAELAHLRQAHPNSITVGVGDLIGASPLASSLLADEPTIEAMNRLGVSLSVVGNHEFDRGSDELLRRVKGICPKAGCLLPGFRGARYEYLAANVIDEATGKTLFPAYAIRTVGGVKIAFVGAVLQGTPQIVNPAGIRGLRFEDEADAINRVLPEIRAQGVHAIVALIHEGADYNSPRGTFNDVGYRCEGFGGPIRDIVRRLDPQIRVVMSAHTHMAYTCNVDGRLVVQGASYGAMITEVDLRVNPRSGEVLDVQAHNELVDQRRLQADPAMQTFVSEVVGRTEKIAMQPAGVLPAGLDRSLPAGSPNADSALGNLIADAQLAFAQRTEKAVEISFMNAGGIRADLPSGEVSGHPVPLHLGDLYAVQPFGNDLVAISLTGAQLVALLNQQGEAQGNRLLQVSRGFAYRWDGARQQGQRAYDLRLNGESVQADRLCRVVVANFLADGGDGLTILTQGRDRRVLGGDIEALRGYLAREDLPAYRSEGRIIVSSGR